VRKLFSKYLHEKMGLDRSIVLITGDLGYGLWDQIRIDYPDRFFNVGSAEQFMIGMSAGMALEGKKPIVYSITPFLLYRPFEFIRNYLDHESIPVKLVGGGRGKDYGSLGFSHWAEDDQKIMSCFDNIEKYMPAEENAQEQFELFFNSKKPCYINLKK
jgi:transketolase